ncbi:MAG: glycosyl hydrolase [Saprospiraceae bacterium]|nr:glycosyl hydrolase [Candidatus Opimibacter skivensis]
MTRIYPAFKYLALIIFLLGTLVPSSEILGQKAKSEKEVKTATPKPIKTGFDTVGLSGLKFRSIGPALTSGRISEIAVDPLNHKRYFIAVSAGGVWRTTNAGTTFEPVFDGEGSYSIGTVNIDPNNPNVIWVGSGENNNQRSVAYGDGVYKSIDGGNTWQNVGLKNSEHIGRVLIHPKNSDVVLVAALGPLWSAGGDRGLYRTKDGGKTWDQVLKIDEHTGVNDIVADPRNPDIMYASSFQRRRHVFTYLGGGPQSTIYKSVDGGLTWNKSAQGLPATDIGRIGLAISPVDPEVIYAMVEAAMGKGGFFRSTNRGGSWEKMSDYAASGNYYVELVPDPVNKDRIYSMDTWMQVSNNGGRSWDNVGEDFKHVDNHCLWIDPTDNEHLLAGCDGGVYESWDLAKTWHFKANLPVTQFYKVSVDNATPFYNIYGGTQDNFSLGGPSRTISGNGISNEEWFVTHGGDGFETQVDPQNPNIVYAQSQYGGLVRYDKLSGEELGIQPHERNGDPTYRWNWDAPLVISAHQPGRLYFAANRVFVSEDRGNNWTVLGSDLTRQVDRNKLKVMGRVWSVDAVAKNQSTSQYGNIVALAESPLDANILYVGTDDGLIQVSTDRGNTWKRIDNIAGAPDTSFVNMIIASAHDANVVYACFNHHKYGDFKPYLFVSKDKGQTWSSISSNLPERGSVYAIAEDHVDPNLLFVGTEFSCFVSNTAGKSWRKLANGLPTIAIKDIAIQQRENDLVLATFGRGFYVLDDYSVLRQLKEENISKDAVMMSVRDALSFENSYPLGLPKNGFQGDSYYRGANLGAEALITYYVKDKIVSAKDQRIKEDEKLAKAGKDNVYPTFEQMDKERKEEKARLYIIIKDDQGNIIRKLPAPADQAGLQRVSWDLRTAAKDPVRAGGPGFYNPFAGITEGTRVAPGAYTASLSRWQDEKMTLLSEPVSFKVVSLQNKVLPADDPEAMVEFKLRAEELQRLLQSVSNPLNTASGELALIRKAITNMEQPEEEWLTSVLMFEDKFKNLQEILYGDPLKTQLDLMTSPSIADRIGRVLYESKYSSSAPTGTHLMSLDLAERQLKELVPTVNYLLDQDFRQFKLQLQEAGAPYVPGMLPALKKD